MRGGGVNRREFAQEFSGRDEKRLNEKNRRHEGRDEQRHPDVERKKTQNRNKTYAKRWEISSTERS